MSYDVWLEIDTGGDEPVAVTDWNYTSNCSAMWREAGANIHEWDGKHVRSVVGELETAIANLQADPEKYRAMNPENGWGTYDGEHGIVERLRVLLAQMRKHPNTRVRVSR